MPTYDYRCPNGHTFEIFQRMSDPPPEACEVCNAAPVERVLFPVAVHFKGSGFYSTDYGRGKKRDATKDGDGSSGEKKKDEKTTTTSTSTSTSSSDSSPPSSSSSSD
jgi:putative FmdB family regulatory protein